LRRIARILAIILVIVALVAGGIYLWGRITEVSTAELEQIIRRDSVPFDPQAIPDQVLDRLASHRVVVVGETHFLREHRELTAELLRELHARGFRQLLVEWTQVADWLLADFVNGGGLEPDWEPPGEISAGVLARAIRDFNRTLSESERIQIHGIDVTLPDYGGAESFLWSLGRLAQHLPDPGPLSEFPPGDYDTPESQTAQVETLQAELKAGRSELVAVWGQYWYDTVIDILEVELDSIPVRALRESDYDKSVRLREDAIKRLVDRRLQDFQHGTLINAGSTHAQKKRLYGTEIEWLGDYLVHKSQAVDGSVIVLDVSAAHIVAVPGSGFPDYDLSASPENELFRMMNQTWPDQIVFLPADDPLLNSGRVPINSEGTIYRGAPKQHFDVYVVLPSAHRVPLER
jgi:hypothetical protein